MGGRLLGPILVAAALAAAPSAASAADCAGADTPIGAQTIVPARDAVLCMVNVERTTRGLGALVRDGVLEGAAQRHTDDMVARNFFEHVNPDGEDPGDRISAAGYDWGYYGENIAAGYETPRQVMVAWMQSTGHCHNVLSPDFTELGVGVAVAAATLPGSQGTWTQDFGRPTGRAAPGGSTAPRDGCPYAGLQSPGTATAASLPSAPAGSATQTAAAPAARTATRAPRSTAHEPARLSVHLVFLGRHLKVSGRLAHSGLRQVHVLVRRHGHLVAAGRAVLRGGRYRLRLRLPAHRRTVTVLVRAGSAHVARRLAR